MNALLTDPMFYAVAAPAVLTGRPVEGRLRRRDGLCRRAADGAGHVAGAGGRDPVADPRADGRACRSGPGAASSTAALLWSDAAGRDDRHRHRLVAGGRGDGRYGAPDRRRRRHLFVGRWLYLQCRHGAEPCDDTQPRLPAAFWGTVAGFTSFVAHVGGPPFQVYALPLRLDPKVITGTSAIFFAVTNAVKLVPYFALGQFDATNLTASAVLMPLAPLATLAGAWLVRRMRPEMFYPFTYATVAHRGAEAACGTARRKPVLNSH